MIAIDTNIMVYAVATTMPLHEPAKKLMGNLPQSKLDWAIPYPCIHEFLAVCSNRRFFGEGAERALDQLEAWLESPWLSLIGEGPGYFSYLKRLVLEAKVSGGQVHDARIAAICLYHGIDELLTCDRDFGRFPDLKVRNPLV